MSWAEAGAATSHARTATTLRFRKLLLELGQALREFLKALFQRWQLTVDDGGAAPLVVIDRGMTGDEAAGINRLQNGALRAHFGPPPDAQMTADSTLTCHQHVVF